MMERRSQVTGLMIAASLTACDRPRTEPTPANSLAVATADSTATDSQDLLDDAAQLVAFLRGESQLEAEMLADSVTLYIAPEGGGQSKRASQEELRDRTAWSVGPHVLLPPADLTQLTTRVNRHFACLEMPLDSRHPQLAVQRHVGALLQRPDSQNYMQSWNMTFVFNDDRAKPLLTAVVYDQWEW